MASPSGPRDPYFVSQRITLSREEVVAALSAAVLARSGELARFGTPRLCSLELDAKVLPGAGVDVVGLVATVEAQLDAGLVAALSGAPALPAPAAD
jgi:hypothetical protein